MRFAATRSWGLRITSLSTLYKISLEPQMLNNTQPHHLRVCAVMGWFSFLSGYNTKTSKIQAPQPNASIPISCPFAFFL